ncbi:nucleolus and neural progenitor protein-like [Polymixia lowei]
MDKFSEERVKVPFGNKHLDAAIHVPAPADVVHTAVILTHGAGGDMNFRHLVSLAHALASNGFICVRFTCKGLNLVYRVKAYHAVLEYLKSLEKFTIKHMFLGGRSMGSRAAAALARQLSGETEDAVQGVVCLSFPLHPPGKTHTHHQRSEDLRGLPKEMPVLFVSGTEDNMCDRGIFDGVVKEMKAQVDVCWLAGGSHGLTVKGRSEDSVLDEVNSQVITWIMKFRMFSARKSMAADPWNRVNIPFPSTASCVRIRFDLTTDANVKNLLVQNDKVLQLLQSKVLQTEIRILYELLYVLHNNYGKNKTYRVLKQVEQCVNRIKEMKLAVALQDLKHLCPTRVQRALSLEAGNCEVPSQPMLEWLCLKVLGAAQLMSCAMNHCSRGFIFAKQQLKLEEFIVLNVVFVGMLSRLWVFFRGVLANLAPLYQQILVLLREVSEAQPMPFLTAFSLPEDIVNFLGPSDASLLTVTLPLGPQAAEGSQPKDKRQAKAAVKSKRKGRKGKEDLGVAVERVQLFDNDVKPLWDVTEAPVENPSQETNVMQKQMFQKQVTSAATFTDMATHLKKMIPWCKSQNLEKETRCLSFLYLKCHKMESLESAGYNFPRKLRNFKHEACWAISPTRSVPRTCLSTAALWRSAHPKTNFRSLRTRFRAAAVRDCAKRRRSERRRTRTELSEGNGDQAGTRGSRTSSDATPRVSACWNQDEIDDIFSSIGL